MRVTKVDDPPFIRFFKWGGIVAGGLIAMGSVASFIGAAAVTAAKWVAAPIIREESAARFRGDSLIISSINALSDKVDLIASGLQSNPGSAKRDRVLGAVPHVENPRVVLPKETRPVGEKK